MVNKTLPAAAIRFESDNDAPSMRGTIPEIRCSIRPPLAGLVPKIRGFARTAPKQRRIFH
jgi:hypothetical protein